MSQHYKISPTELVQMQQLPLELKILKTKQRIKEFYEAVDGQVYVAFSGGKDSTVLLDIVRSMYPKVPAVFLDTGVELPEVRKFALSVSGVEAVRPKYKFIDIVKKDGYPIISKAVAGNIIAARRGRGSLKNFDREHYDTKKFYRLSRYRWQCALTAPFLISDLCCDKLKKFPAKDFAKKRGLYQYVGTMAAEGGVREQNYLLHGCNVLGGDSPTSRPMSFWTEEDVWEYINTTDLPISEAYYKGATRTGCMFCGFGMLINDKDQKLMAQTNPAAFKYFWEGGEFDDRGLWVPNKEGLGFKYVYNYLFRRREDWRAILRGEPVSTQSDIPNYVPWTRQYDTVEELQEVVRAWREEHKLGEYYE